MNGFSSYIEFLWISILSYPLIIQVAIFFILFGVAATVSFMIIVMVLNRKRAKSENKSADLDPRMEHFFQQIIFSDKKYSIIEITDQYNSEFGKIKKSDYICITKALEQIKNKVELVDQHLTNFEECLYAFKVVDYLEGKLDSSNTREKLNALHLLANLGIKISESKILPNAYAKNSSLRKESRASYMALSTNDPFKFFDELTNLNQWNQMSLMMQFKKHHKDNLPNFNKWIKYTKNNEQIIFFIRMIEHFKQESSVDCLIELLDHDDHEVRNEAIMALGKMLYTPIEDKLKEIFTFQPEECQSSIIQAISLLNTGKSLEFLKEIYKKESNYENKKLIAEAIYNYGEEGRLYFEILENLETGFNLLILEHVKNPLIQSQMATSSNTRNKENDSKTMLGSLASI